MTVSFKHKRESTFYQDKIKRTSTRLLLCKHYGTKEIFENKELLNTFTLPGCHFKKVAKAEVPKLCKSTFINGVVNTFMKFQIYAGFPLGLKNLEKWEGIFQSGNFEQTGKVRENHTKYWKTPGISDKYYLLFFSDI